MASCFFYIENHEYNCSTLDGIAVSWQDGQENYTKISDLPTKLQREWLEYTSLYWEKELKRLNETVPYLGKTPFRFLPEYLKDALLERIFVSN